MKKNYIAPFMETIVTEDLCDIGLNEGSHKEKNTTPGNDMKEPGQKPGFGGDEGEDTDPAAKPGIFTPWDD